MKLNKNQQLKVNSDKPQQNENKETQLKTQQLKVHTGLRVGVCTWDPNCEKYWCY
jgi:hypothetical protein